MKASPPMPAGLSQLLTIIAEDRDAFIRTTMQLSIPDGKSILNTILNGGAAPDAFKKKEWVGDLQRLAVFLRWFACSALPVDYKSLEGNKVKTFPSSTIFHLLWTAVEDYLLEKWCDCLEAMQPKPRHLSLHFDGVRVDSKSVPNVLAATSTCEQYIKDRTGFDVKIVQKEHLCLLALLRKKVVDSVVVEQVPAVCLEPGNCIPCALWHERYALRSAITAGLSNGGHKLNVAAKTTRTRSYSECSTLFGMPLASATGVPDVDVRSFILHSENDGKPHCVCVQYNESQTEVSVIDGSQSSRMSIQEFQGAVGECTDRSSLVSYWHSTDTNRSAAETHLLDMRAGHRRETCALGIVTCFSCNDSQTRDTKDEHAHAAVFSRGRPQLQTDMHALHICGEGADGEDSDEQGGCTSNDTAEPRLSLLRPDVLAGASDTDGAEDEMEEKAVHRRELVIVDDEGDVWLDDQLLEKLATETAEYIRRIPDVTKADGGFRCELCAFRMFKRKAALRVHVETYHTATVQYVCSGTKQVKLISALSDYYASQQDADQNNYLRESSDILRKTILPSLSTAHNDIDRHIRLVFTVDGPVFYNASTICADADARRVGNIYYTQDFAELIARELILHRGQVPWLHVMVIYSMFTESVMRILFVSALLGDLGSQHLASFAYTGA
jgi:hypothetical protein